LLAYLAVETGIPISVLISEPEDYINAMLIYLNNGRRSPFEPSRQMSNNAQALSQLDELL
jgi:antitoxin component of RelBE/YafQ-DinJ toxin-antitoxin module